MRLPSSVGTLALTVVVGGLVTSMAAATSGPSGVSPGRPDESALIDTRCPTFSWTAEPDAAGYEIVVLEWTPGVGEREPTLRQTIAGGAVSWTPSLDLCLEWGGSYAWSVSAQDESAWSKPLLFSVASREVALAGSPVAAELDSAGDGRTPGSPVEAAVDVPPSAQAPPGSTTPVASDGEPSAPASDQLMIGGIPVTLESYDHSFVFDKLAGGITQATSTSFVEIASVSIDLDSHCTFPFTTRWNLLVMANAVAFSLGATDAAKGDLAVSVDDPTGSDVGNSDLQSFSVDELGSVTSLAGVSLFSLLQDVGTGTREISLLARRSNLTSANIAFNNYRLGAMALGFDCELFLPP